MIQNEITLHNTLTIGMVLSTISTIYYDFQLFLFAGSPLQALLDLRCTDNFIETNCMLLLKQSCENVYQNPPDPTIGEQHNNIIMNNQNIEYLVILSVFQ